MCVRTKLLNYYILFCSHSKNTFNAILTYLNQNTMTNCLRCVATEHHITITVPTRLPQNCQQLPHTIKQRAMIFLMFWNILILYLSTSLSPCICLSELYTLASHADNLSFFVLEKLYCTCGYGMCFTKRASSFCLTWVSFLFFFSLFAFGSLLLVSSYYIYLTGEMVTLLKNITKMK